MVHQVAAKSPLLLSLDLDRKQLEHQAKALCTELLPDWRDANPEDVEVSEISGGITNLLWKLSYTAGNRASAVVVRVFGKQTDIIIDRAREEVALEALNRGGFGAQVLAKFANGRIEAFLPMRALTPEEMTTSQMAAKVARALRRFHAVPIPGADRPELFSTIRAWITKAERLEFDSETAKAEAHASIDFARWRREVEGVEAACSRLEPRACFAHNDLLSGNILVPEQEGCAPEVQFIDFEYSAPAYVAYDFANHFCEYAGFECEYGRYPSREHIAHFARSYLSQSTSQAPEEKEVEALVVSSNAFALASHQYWGTWAVLQAKHSPIDFDYMSYSRLRWDEFFRRKEEFLGHVAAYLTRNGSQ